MITKNFTESVLGEFGVIISEEDQRNALKNLILLLQQSVLSDKRLQKYNGGS